MYMPKIFMTIQNGQKNPCFTLVFHLKQMKTAAPEGKEAGIFLIPLSSRIRRYRRNKRRIF
jgi:hypothetical protein